MFITARVLQQDSSCQLDNQYWLQQDIIAHVHSLTCWSVRPQTLLSKILNLSVSNTAG